jgi:hypothetical protein
MKPLASRGASPYFAAFLAATRRYLARPAVPAAVDPRPVRS